MPGGVDSERVAEAGGLRLERDRFLAFAFAMADVLIEVEPNGIVRYAAGAARAVLGVSPEKLVGSNLVHSVPLAERPMLRQLLADTPRAGRRGPIPLHPEKGRGRVLLSANVLPERPRSLFVSIRAETLGSAPRAESGAFTAPAPGEIGDRKSLGQMAVEAMRDGGERRLSFIEASGLASLSQKLEAGVAEELNREIGLLLAEASLEGRGAAALEPDRFGLLHEAGLDMDGLARRIEDISRKRDPMRKGIRLSASTLDLVCDSGHENESADALLYAISSFTAQPGGLTLKELAEGTTRVLGRATHRIGELRETISSNKFALAFQPVVSLKDLTIHHYEALIRLPSGEPTGAAIAFAEQVGLIPEIDLAATHKTLALLAKAQLAGQPFRASINLSGRSIEDPRFIEALHKLLNSYQMVRGQALFEITESCEIKDLGRAAESIAGLRRKGLEVCLDDFGAGAAAFHYLRALEVDYVKIDGQYVREIENSRRDQHFLRAMVGLCKDLGIATIGEMIETKETADHLVKIGIDYGQGYLFGKPEAQPKAGVKLAPKRDGAAQSAPRPASGASKLEKRA